MDINITRKETRRPKKNETIIGVGLRFSRAAQKSSLWTDRINIQEAGPRNALFWDCSKRSGQHFLRETNYLKWNQPHFFWKKLTNGDETNRINKWINRQITVELHGEGWKRTFALWISRKLGMEKMKNGDECGRGLYFNAEIGITGGFRSSSPPLFLRHTCDGNDEQRDEYHDSEAGLRLK